MLISLTPPELLLVDRRRRDETQAQAARRLGQSVTRYSRLERGLEPVPPNVKVPSLRQLRPNELCLVLRRRAGKTQLQVATELGRCKMWVRQMERGEVDSGELARYWGI